MAEISILKRKNVGRRKLKPKNDSGTVKKSQVGPYGKYLWVQCIKESIGSEGKSNAL